MKRSLLFLSFCTTILGMKAQITVTTADVAVPGKLVYQSNDTMPTVSAGGSGISQTWNMAALNSHTVDTINFAALTWVPNQTAFPTSDLVVKIGWKAQYSYLLNNSSGLTILGNIATVDPGTGVPTTIIQHNTPPEKLLDFPTTYGTSFADNHITSATFYYGADPGVGFTVDSIRQKSTINKVSLCDAWGSITTPLSTFASLRVNEITHQTDSTFGYVSGFGWIFFQQKIDSTKKYTWWANGVGFPLVETTMDPTGTTVKSATWLQALPALGINEYTAAVNVNVFPNPAQDQINFTVEAAKVVSIRVFDITGRIVNSYPVSNGRVAINTSGFADGVYSYSIIGKENAVLDRGKFTVAK